MRQVVSVVTLVLASFAGVSAQEEMRTNRSNESNNPCSRCKTRVAPPPGSVEYKIRIFTPNSDADYKLKVLCMCPREEVFVAAMPRVLPPPLLVPPRTFRYYVPQPSGSDAFVKPPSFSYRLMPDSTGAPRGTPSRVAPRLNPFVNER